MALSMFASTAAAQVDKRVEVTKDYRPEVSEAVKLPIAPDMADTVKMRPEIDYTITPLMYSTELVTTRNIKPATVTYWNFNRPTNFYLKLGVGYPINTVGDFYMSTHNVRTGYLMAAANHYGEFGKMANFFGDRRNAMKSSTRARVAGGLYWGKHMFEGELAYGSEVAGRFAAPLSALSTDGSDPNLKAEYEDFTLKLRLGDDFVDLSRTNFNVEFKGAFFNNKSDWSAADYNLQQFDFGADAKVGRRFGRHYVEADAGINALRGIKDLHSRNNTASVGLRYGYTSNRVELLLGADYARDWSSAGDGKNYILPVLKLELDVTNNDAVIPFVEAEGTLRNNDYYYLSRETVYVGFDESMQSLPNTLTYDIRLGLTGKFGRGRLGYRLWAGMSFAKDELYWYNYNYEWLMARTGGENAVSLNLELDYRPIDGLLLSAGVHGRFFNESAEFDDGTPIRNGKSPVDGFFKIRYKHKKFAVGAYAKMCGAAEWSSVTAAVDTRAGDDDVVGPDPLPVPEPTPAMTVSTFRAPGYVDVGVEFEWRIKQDWTLFVEGSNLTNSKIYNLAYFREQGIRCTAGFKFVF